MIVSNDEVLEARKKEVLALPTFADKTKLKPAAEEMYIFLVAAPRGGAAEMVIDETMATTAALECVTKVYDHVKTLVDAQADQVNLASICPRGLGSICPSRSRSFKCGLIQSLPRTRPQRGLSDGQGVPEIGQLPHGCMQARANPAALFALGGGYSRL